MKKNVLGIVIRIIAFILGFYVFAQEEKAVEPILESQLIEQVAQKVEQTVVAFNQASMEKQKPALDLLFNAGYTHENIHVRAASWAVLDVIEVKYETSEYSGSRVMNTDPLALFPPKSDHSVDFQVSNPEKPMSGNISDIFIDQEQENLQAIGGELGYDGYHDMLLLTYATQENSFEIKGKVRNDIAILEVMRDGDQKIEKLSDFEAGQQDFVYKISPREKNIKLGANNYMIRGYADDAIYQAVVTVVHLNDKSGSLAGEKVINNTDEGDERWKKVNECYLDFQGQEEQQQTCINQVTQDYTIDQARACDMDDGRLNYFFQIQRPNKAAVIEHLYKKGSRLYYPVKLGNQYPGCEDDGYEVLLYYYDCASGERVKVLGNNPDEERFLKCDLQIQYADNDYMLVRKHPYERYGSFEGYELVSVAKKGVEKLTLIDTIQIIGTGGETKEIKGFEGNQELKEKVAEIVSLYNLGSVVYDGINYEIREVQDDLTATLRVFIYGWADTSIVYDAKVDLLNKKITFGD